MKGTFLQFIILTLSLSACSTEFPFKNRLLIEERSFLNSTSYEGLRPAFISLAPGSIMPEGWIRDFAEAAVLGITGNLDEYSITYREGWKGKGFIAQGTNPEDGTGWSLEQCAYWLDGAVSLGYILNDSALIKKVSSRLDQIVSGVLERGSTFIYWKPIEFLEEDGFNNWAHSHIGRALITYYRATGEKRVLDALEKVYAEYPLPVLPYHFFSVTGAVNLDVMLQVYQLTGNRKIKERMMGVIESEKFDQVIERWCEEDIPVGHGVIMYENIRVPALAYQLSGKDAHLQATKACLEWIKNNHLLPNGIASSEEHVAGIGSTRNVETCNIACAPLPYQKLMQITGNGIYADPIERIFFNAAPVAVTSDNKEAVYYQSMNKVADILPGEFPNAPMDISPEGSRISSYQYRPEAHTVLCCVGNSTRAIPYYIQNMWMATLDHGVVATLYGPSTVKTVAGNNNTELIIEEKTTYPFEDKINFIIYPAKSVSFPLYLRIPEWCQHPGILLNGQRVPFTVNNNFVKIDRKWKSKDVIELNLPMKIYLENGKETSYPDVPYFNVDCTEAIPEVGRCLSQVKDISNPYQTISYGPLLFSLPLHDIDANTQDVSAKWKYALNVQNMDTDIRVERVSMPSYWSWKIDNSPLKLTVKAKEIDDWNPNHLQPLPKEEVIGGKDCMITLVPYGCTKFRITMFPISKSAGNNR